MEYPQMVAEKWADMTEEQREIHLPLVQDKKNQSVSLAYKLASNNTYYKHNKVDIKKDRNQKVVCPVCGLSISKQNVIKHPNTNICKLTSENNKLKEEVEELNKYNKILVTKLNRKTRKPLK